MVSTRRVRLATQSGANRRTMGRLEQVRRVLAQLRRRNKEEVPRVQQSAPGERRQLLRGRSRKVSQLQHQGMRPGSAGLQVGKSSHIYCLSRVYHVNYPHLAVCKQCRGNATIFIFLFSLFCFLVQYNRTSPKQHRSHLSKRENFFFTLF